MSPSRTPRSPPSACPPPAPLAPIALEKCGDKGSWYNQGFGILGNGWYGESGDLDTQAVGNGYYLYALDSLDGGKYLTWNAPGIN